jgi:hypothetical protein
MLNLEHQIGPTVARCLCKIAFNYLALVCGQEFALAPCFDEMRSFIRFEIGDAHSRVFLKKEPIIAQEILSGERYTDGHVVIAEGKCEDRVVESQLALFNSLPYRIPLSRDYRGPSFAKGHHFDVHTGKASEMRHEIAGPEFGASH